MNRIYRLVWNQSRHVWMAVAENAKGHSKSVATRKLIAGVLALTGSILLAPAGLAAPVDGQVSAGSGSIAQAGATTTITQSSQNLAINWQGFGVAANEAVRFNQPNASAIALNRVLGQSPSDILGSISANGQVFVLNPNGVLFGAGSQVNVGGLVASTLNLSDADFMAGKHSFDNGGAAGAVLNQGSLSAANGGYIALLAPDVRNEGVISATLGTALFAAGDKVTLTLNNGSLLAYSIDRGSLNALADNKQLIQADGGQVFMSARAANALGTAMVNNTGIVEARTVQEVAGVIKLMSDMHAGTVNVGGTLDASAANGGNGGFIETSAAHVNIANDAKVTTASSMGLGGIWMIDPVDFTIAATGGNMTGATLSTNLANNAVVSILSSNGTVGTAGDVNVNEVVTWSVNQLVLNAQNNININANLNASGTAKLALEYGQGAVAAGNTSSYILAPNVQVNLPAGPNFSTKLGSDGVIKNYTVITGLGAMGSTTGADLQGMRGSLARHYALGSDIDAAVTSGWNGGGGFIPVGQFNAMFTGTLDGLGHSITNLTVNYPSNLNVGLFGYVGAAGTVKNVGLVGGSVTGHSYVGELVGYNAGSISNSYATGAVTGNGTIGGLVGYNAGNVSNSYATGNVIGTGSNVGGLVGFNYGSISNSYATGAVTGTNNVGGLVGYASDLSTVSNSHYNIDTVVTNGVTSHVTPYGLYNAQYLDWFNNSRVLSIASYASTLPLNNGYYQISTVQGLKDLLGFTDNATYKFRLTANLDLAAIPGWHLPYFAGLEFDGAGHALNNLAINQPMNSRIGFIGMLAAGSQLNNLGLTNVSVTAVEYVGGLVGEQYGTISNSYTSGMVTGLYYVGGLVGINQSGTISNSYVTGTVAGDIYVGGLVGLDYGNISNSYATGSVTGGSFAVGGLVGEHDDGIISNSYATGTVTGTDYGVGGLVGAMYGGAISNSHAIGGVSGGNQVGGLVGYHNNSGGMVSTSYATGNVIGTGSNVGGLVGNNAVGTVSITYATGSVSGISNVGGLVGNNDAGTVSNSYATGLVSGTGTQGGLVGNNLGTVSNAYATGLVSGIGTKGGLVGNNAGTVSNGFWDTQTSGQPTTGIGAGSTTGATGRTTAEMISMSTFSNAGWDIANTGGSGTVWRIYEGNATPWLVWWLKPVTVSLNSDTKTYSGAPYSGGNGYAVGNPAPSLSGTVGSPNPVLSGTLAYGDTSQSAVNAGSYTIGASGLYSVQQGYDISYVDGTLTIDRAALTLSGTRVYNGLTAYAGSNLTATGVNGETFAIDGAGNTTNLGSANVQIGSTLTSLTGLTLGGGSGGGLSSNYTALSTTGSSVNVTAASLTVTADDKSRLYGQANPALTTTVSGFVNGETAGTAAGFTGAGSATTTASANTNVGTAVIAAGAGSLAATNYAFTTLVDGTLTITPVPGIIIPAAEIITLPVGGILPAVVAAINALPGGAGLLPAFSSTVTVAASLVDANVPPIAFSNLQYVYLQATPGSTSTTIVSAADAATEPAKVQGAQSDGFNKRLVDSPIQFSGTVLVRNGGITLPRGVKESE